IGADRVGDANQLTLGVTSDLVEPNSGRTVLQLQFGRVFGFRDLRVHLPYGKGFGYGESSSDYVAGVDYRPTDNIHTGVHVQYDADNNSLNRATARVDLRGDSGLQLHLGYQR